MSMRTSYWMPLVVSVAAVLSLTGCPELLGPIVLDFTNVTEDMTLPAGTYLADQSITVSGGTLTLAPGVIIKFAAGEGLTVNENGSLSAVGTAAQPILLTGQDSTDGFWSGLRFSYSNSASNELEYVTIEYAGDYWNANLSVTGDSRLSVSHCLFRHSDKHGFRFDSNANIEFSDNVSTLNHSSAGSIAVAHVGILGGGEYSGNTTDVVLVDGGTLDTEATWPALSVPYSLTGSVTVDSDLTIAAGARFLFAAGEGLTVSDTGSLAAVGTATSPILFSGADTTPGYWAGVRFSYSNSASNRLEYVTIEYAGDYWNANLSVTGNTRLEVSHCTFRNSSENGFRLDSGSNLQFSENTATGNATSAGSVAVQHVGLLGGGTYTGNEKDVILVDNGTLEDEATWAALGVDYSFQGSVNLDAALTIEAGARLIFGSGDGMTINETGSLTAIGTPEAGIVFTAASLAPGYWAGVRFSYSNSMSNQMEYVTLEYAGYTWDANISMAGNSRLAMTNCTLTNSSGWGITVGSSCTVNDDLATANTFANNDSGDVQTL